MITRRFTSGPFLSSSLLCLPLAVACGAQSTSAPVAPTESKVSEATEIAEEEEETSEVAAPSEVLDLSSFKLTLPDLDPARGKAKEVKEAELNGRDGFSAYTHPDWFYVDTESQAVIFKTPNHLATTKNSKNTRSELREMVRAGNTEIGTKDMKNNWTIAAHPRASEYGAIGGTLEATLSVDWVSTSGDEEKFAAHAVVVGQIHGSGKTEPLKIFYRKLPGHEKGSLFWNYESRPADESKRQDISLDVWGNHQLKSEDEEPSDGLKLGERFSYSVEVNKNEMRLTFSREGTEDSVHVHDLSVGHPKIANDQGYSDDWMYFKAGAYNQCNLGTEGVWGSACENRGLEAGDYTQVSFYSLGVSHE